MKFINEVWLSLVEHYVRDVGAAGSNPVIPTKNGLDHIFKKHAGFYQRAFSFISPFLKQEGNENHVGGERCF